MFASLPLQVKTVTLDAKAYDTSPIVTACDPNTRNASHTHVNASHLAPSKWIMTAPFHLITSQLRLIFNVPIVYDGVIVMIKSMGEHEHNTDDH